MRTRIKSMFVRVFAPSIQNEQKRSMFFDVMNPSQSYRIIQYNLWLTVKTYSEAFQKFSEALEKEFLLLYKARRLS